MGMAAGASLGAVLGTTGLVVAGAAAAGSVVTSTVATI
jgi:hypothetical protein